MEAGERQKIEAELATLQQKIMHGGEHIKDRVQRQQRELEEAEVDRAGLEPQASRLADRVPHTVTPCARVCHAGLQPQTSRLADPRLADPARTTDPTQTSRPYTQTSRPYTQTGRPHTDWHSHA